MATNNVINLKSSGIVSYDAAGAFTALANPLTVGNGGSGASSFTAYATLCGGTTSTNPIQSIAGVGTSGQFLTSNGASALPTFQPTTSGFSWKTTCTATGNPASNTTYYISYSTGATFTNVTSSGTTSTIFMVPIACTFTSFILFGTCTAGSSENCTVEVFKNSTTATTITSSLKMDAATFTATNTALSVALSAGDFIEIRITTPNPWSSLPTAVGVSCMCWFT